MPKPRRREGRPVDNPNSWPEASASEPSGQLGVRAAGPTNPNYLPAASARASKPRAITRRWISLVPSPISISGASR